MVKLFLQNKGITKILTLYSAGIFLFCSAEATRGAETMGDLTKLEETILDHEEYKRHAYECPVSQKLHIGIGRNLEDKGLSFDEALYLLRNDIEECELDLRKIFEGCNTLSDDRQRALIELRFILGSTGFRNFDKMIAAIKKEDFSMAAAEMKMSRWFSQVGMRGEYLYDMILGLDEFDEDVEYSVGIHDAGIGAIYFDEFIDLDEFMQLFSPLMPEGVRKDLSDKKWRSIPINEE